MAKSNTTTLEKEEANTGNAVHDAVSDLKSLVRDAEEILAQVGDDASDEVVELRKRMRAAIKDNQLNLEDLRKQAREKLESCDEYVQSHPYHSLGIAAAVGAVVGILVSHRSH